MSDTMTTRRKNGVSMGYGIADEGDGWDEYRSLSASVNRACSKWLENKLGYKPTFGGMRYGKGTTAATFNPKAPITNEVSPDPSIQ